MVEFMKSLHETHFTVKEGKNTLGDIIDAYLFTIEEVHKAHHVTESYDWEKCNKVICVLCRETLEKHR